MPDLPKDPPDLGSLQELRESLEGALIQNPAEPEPPELRPLLLLPLEPTQKIKFIEVKKLLKDNLEWDFLWIVLETEPPKLRPLLLLLPMEPIQKIKFMEVKKLLKDNLEWNPEGLPHGLEALRTALNILEKYGRNLLSPRPPRHWRGVRFGNPVFKSTVGAIQGGRAVLKLLGYTEESGEGLSFPSPPQGPLPPRVAAVTADVLVLRHELQMLMGNQHPNPQFFTQILLGEDEWPLASDAVPEQLLPAGDPAPPGVGEGRVWRCRSCTFINPSPTVLCRVCERPRLAPRPQPSPSPTPVWPCPRCTFINRGHAPNCDVCGHATSGDVITETTPVSKNGNSGSKMANSKSETVSSGFGPTSSGDKMAASGGANGGTSGVEGGTSCSGHASSGFNMAASSVGHACSGDNMAASCGGHGGSSGVEEGTSGFGSAPSRDALRQRRLLQDGRRLLEIVKAAESQGLPPESLGPAPFSHFPAISGPSPAQLRHFRAFLGAELRALAGGGASLGPFSLAEAAWAWLEGEGDPERARRVLIGRRRRQLQLLSSLGFPDPVPVSEALQRHRGSHWGALQELQALRLHPFRLRHQQGAGPGLDFNRPDQQALLRQILATLPVASWGRASLVASLGRELGLGRVPEAEPSKEPLLGELVEAVGSCQDRAALLRRLRCECSVCSWALPRLLMQWLPGCSCPLCPECFRLHFTVGLRERGVGALGCPSCGRPDLHDDAQRLWYWSTLEPELRRSLDPDTFALVTRKLTELELQRDPQFLWCPHCSFGFIFEAEKGPAQCPQCHQCCCPRCQRPWDPRHSSLSCADFGLILRSGEPEMGPGELLGDTGIECPQCGQRFALARGGCLHFQCSQCRHQFCAGCGGQFHRPGSCPIPQCPLRGSLHGHHPRDCLFYLRDWEPPRLQQLLQSANVAFETEPPPEAPPNPTGLCPVPEQKEVGAAFRDEPCGRETAPGQAGLCRAHYSEYLVSLINRHGLDPAPLYDPGELRAAAERHLLAGKSQRRPGETEAEHWGRVRHLLALEAPVRPRPPRPRTRPLC